MLFNSFLFYASPQYFPGYEVVKPFYLKVEYAYYPGGLFSCVLYVEIPFKAIVCLRLGGNIAQEIEEAARQHLIQTFVKDPDDLKDVLNGIP